MSSLRPDLTGLDDVPWESTDDPYGPSIYVAARIRALAGYEERSREDVLDELWQDLNHQGTVYEPAVPAVPFLVQIATTPGHERALHTLLLVGSIAHGSSGPDYSPTASAERARQAIGAHGQALLDAVGDGGWPFLVRVAYVADAAAPELAPAASRIRSAGARP